VEIKFNNTISVIQHKDCGTTDCDKCNHYVGVVDWSVDIDIGKSGLSSIKPKINKVTLDGYNWDGKIDYEFIELSGYGGVKFILEDGNIFEEKVLTLGISY
jgi:hypothetical protein